MKRKRFTEEQIIGIVRESEAGTGIPETSTPSCTMRGRGS